MNRWFSLGRIVAIVVIVGVCATAAPAQTNGEGVRFDNIEALPDSRPVMDIVLGAFCLIGSMAIGFKSSHRSQEKV